MSDVAKIAEMWLFHVEGCSHRRPQQLQSRQFHDIWETALCTSCDHGRQEHVCVCHALEAEYQSHRSCSTTPSPGGKVLFQQNHLFLLFILADWLMILLPQPGSLTFGSHSGSLCCNQYNSMDEDSGSNGSSSTSWQPPTGQGSGAALTLWRCIPLPSCCCSDGPDFALLDGQSLALCVQVPAMHQHLLPRSQLVLAL